ncbi:GNAT family N-acetyltransferase [Amycolatopsis tucumanensis]|uniref:GNAT family N-acetyltransferase n=1 Tax=Amycolatopsis tucumanensis TaxID=401106 RepID=A0ABP7JLX4_9PSEU|nr:GNAT family N-acetyltransferase [Amycolatopsis tucumanensis]MCF6426764.1 GNAT family N-acetyltransferase [Amycolatopsis tucumanensis]
MAAASGDLTRSSDLRITELTAGDWPLFERLLGPGGLQGGCWCAWFRMTSRQFRETGPEGHKAHVRDEVRAGKPLGLLGILDDEPVAWVAVSPRLDNPRLATSRVAALPDDDPTDVWSVTCFYVHRRARGRGIAAAMLRAATRHAFDRGARVVEGYPVDARKKRPAGELYHGTVEMFAAAGFELTARRDTVRALMRISAR